MNNKYLRTDGSVYHVEAKLFHRVKDLETKCDKDEAKIKELTERINQLENKGVVS